MNFGQKLENYYLSHINETKSRKRGYLFFAYHGNFEGLNSEEIEQLRVAQAVERLPHIYVEFLQTMGRSSGGIFTGCDLNFETLLELKKILLRFMEVNRQSGMEIPLLPEDAFVFLSIQGVDFFFFRTDSLEDDPAVYYYFDGMKKYYEVTSSLSLWLWEHAFNPTKETEKFLDDLEE
jgi:hypothetical protein